MKDIILMLFSESFLLRALVAGLMISLCSALLGVSLVLKKFSMKGRETNTAAPRDMLPLASEDRHVRCPACLCVSLQIQSLCRTSQP